MRTVEDSTYAVDNDTACFTNRYSRAQRVIFYPVAERIPAAKARKSRSETTTTNSDTVHESVIPRRCTLNV